MSRLTKLISLAALLVAPSMATAAEVNVVSWGGAYTKVKKRLRGPISGNEWRSNKLDRLQWRFE